MLENYTGTKYKALFILFCFLSISVSSQTNNRLTKPYFLKYGGGIAPHLCVSDAKLYEVPFTNNGATLTGTLVVQLSDANGDFTTPIVQKYMTDHTSNTYKAKFSIPTGTSGAGFKLRVKIMSTGEYSPESDPIPIYYNDGTKPRLDDKNGVDGKVKIVLCANSTSTLQLKDRNLDYIWYKGNDVIPNESSYSLVVSSSGSYHAVPAVGGVCAFRSSNNVIVSVVNGSSINIGSVSEVKICSNDKHTFTASIQDIGLYNYSWYKDGVLVSGTTNLSTYETVGDSSQFGMYKVRASANSNGTCELVSPEISLVQKTGNFSVALEVPKQMFLIPGSQVDLKISYSGSATVQWYFKSSTASSFMLISTATLDTYVANQKGTYYAEVTTDASTGSCSPISKSGKVEVLSVDGIIPFISLSDDYDSCKSSETKLEVKNKIKSGGDEYEMPASLKSSMVYQWSKKSRGGVYQVISAITKEVELSSNEDNATYKVEVSSGSLKGVSNEVEVKLLIADFKIESSSPSNLLCADQTLELSVSPKISGVFYTWSKDGSDISIEEKIIVEEIGTYVLVVKAFGCEKILNLEVKSGSCSTTGADVVGEPIQNIISPFNADQTNDFWILPNKFTQESVRVIVYNTQGKELLNTTAYQNNWPPSTTEIGKQMILYYKIINKEKLVKAGTISVIK